MRPCLVGCSLLKPPVRMLRKLAEARDLGLLNMANGHPVVIGKLTRYFISSFEGWVLSWFGPHSDFTLTQGQW